MAGADQIKLGYVSRRNPNQNISHVILGTQSYRYVGCVLIVLSCSRLNCRPAEFALQINLNQANMWGILEELVGMFSYRCSGNVVDVLVR